MAELIVQERGCWSIYQGPFEPGEAAQLFQQLEKSGAAINLFYALCGRASLAVLRPEGDRVSRDAVALIDQAIDRCKQFGYDRAPYSHAKFAGGNSAFQTQLIALRGKAEQMHADVAQSTAPVITGKKRHRLPELSLRPLDRGRRITFHPVAEVKADWPRLMSCGGTFDVMWSPQRLAVMVKKGLVEQLLAADLEDAIEGAAWDGRNLWVARRKSGITLITQLLTSRSLLQIGAENGLPDYEPLGPPAAQLPPYGVKPSLQLHAIAPGKCMAAGQLGQYARQWIALISEQDQSKADRVRVQVFHSATKVARVDASSEDDFDRIGSLGAFLELPDPHASNKAALILPRNVSEFALNSDDPLVIDPQALKVSVQPGLFPKLRPVADPPPVTVGRRVFQLNRSWYEITAHWPEESAGKSTWQTKSFHEFNAGHSVTAKQWEKTAGGFALLASNGKVYSPGSHWHRLDPQTLEFECLNKLRLPQNHDYQRYAISAHYGMVAWSNEANFIDAWTEKHRLFRVVIDGSEPEPVAATYSFVPPAKREAHHQAVEALRAKGASVSSNTIEFVNTIETGAQLDENWTGSDQDLRHLASLHRLIAVNLVKAPVTNEGMKEIGNLTELKWLCLVETQVTDAGIANLSKLGQLRELWLEGKLGRREFSDACLSDLKSLPNLQGLTLYGSGFTDAAVRQLKEFAALRRLTLISTAITADGVRALREQKRGTPPNRTTFYMGPTGVFVEP